MAMLQGAGWVFVFSLLMPTGEEKLRRALEQVRWDRAAAGSEDPATMPPSNRRRLGPVETRFDHFRPAIEGKGGVYVGVGAYQNYMMAAWVRPELMVLVDREPLVIDTHRFLEVVFARADTPEELLALMSRPQAVTTKALVEQYYEGEPVAKRGAVWAFRTVCADLLAELEELNEAYRQAGVDWFLTDPEQYRTVRDLFRHKRVVLVRGDLQGRSAMQGLARVLSQHTRSVRVLYLSSLEQSFQYDERFLANVAALPTDEQSVVLRTRSWHRWVKDGKAPLHHSYDVQGFDNFREWLALPRTRNVRRMLGWDTLAQDELFTMSRRP